MDERHGANAVGALIRGARRRARLSLEALAQRAGCARSHLSQIETGKRRAGEELLVRLEESLGLASGVLVGAAGLSRAPDVLRKRVSDLEARTAAARRLADILRGSGIGDDGSIRGALDVAHRTGELERLVGVIAPGDRGGTGGSTGNAKGARGREGEAAEGPGAEDASEVLPVGRVMPRVVPLINAVAAGSPAEFTDLGYPARIADEYVRTEEIDDPDAFAARVVGDSMSPDYREGDVVVFSPVLAAASGDDCFARLEPDHESTFKRAFFETDGKGREVVRLQPLNPAYAARVVRREEVAGLYPAVAVQRKVRRG
ncbi:MAG: XRE family transcriptional regulator [Phycisphaerales bacterium]